MIRHRWKLLLSLVFLVIVAVLIIDWAVETPAEQLNHKIQTQPTPAYDMSVLIPDDDQPRGYSCPRDESCLYVTTEATGAKNLASITEEVALPIADHPGVVEFWPANNLDPDARPMTAISYCFESKDDAISALRGALEDADLLGKTDNCYVTLYKGRGLGPTPGLAYPLHDST